MSSSSPNNPSLNGAVPFIAGGFSIGIVLLAGVLHVLLALAFAALAAITSLAVLNFLAGRLGWPFRFNRKGFFGVLAWGFLTYTGVTWALEFITQTHISTPMMVVALNRLDCYPCTFSFDVRYAHPIVQSLGDYYAYATKEFFGPVGYVVLQAPGLAALAFVLNTAPAKAFRSVAGEAPAAFAGPGGLSRLVITSVVALATALIVAMPVVTWFLLELRTAAQ